MCITWFILILEILLEKQLQGNFAGDSDPNAWHSKGFSKSFVQFFLYENSNSDMEWKGVFWAL